MRAKTFLSGVCMVWLQVGKCWVGLSKVKGRKEALTEGDHEQRHGRVCSLGAETVEALQMISGWNDAVGPIVKGIALHVLGIPK